MAGGMAAPETFDPKSYMPFEVGLPVEKVMSTFPAIDTAVDNIKISQGWKTSPRSWTAATLIRSHVLPDLGHILHSRHQYHWHTGYVPPQTVACAAPRRVDGPRAGPEQPGHSGVHQHRPAAGRQSARSEELKAFHTAGFFGSEFGPMNLPYPDEAVEAGPPAAGMTPGRFANRYKLYRNWSIASSASAST